MIQPNRVVVVYAQDKLYGGKILSLIDQTKKAAG
jgi:hypothetical protein